MMSFYWIQIWAFLCYQPSLRDKLHQLLASQSLDLIIFHVIPLTMMESYWSSFAASLRIHCFSSKLHQLNVADSIFPIIKNYLDPSLNSIDSSSMQCLHLTLKNTSDNKPITALIKPNWIQKPYLIFAKIQIKMESVWILSSTLITFSSHLPEAGKNHINCIDDILISIQSITWSKYPNYRHLKACKWTRISTQANQI
jgi:hypothetical protein